MNYDYLKYDAQSLQELLRRKLLQGGVYTDQMYPGSDTKIVLDLFAWTYDVLTYVLNNNAADSLFADTQVYENMNRLVKLLSYNPDGYHSSNCTFRLSLITSAIRNGSNVLPDVCTIPKFTSIDLGKIDSNGNAIKYSFVDDYKFRVSNTAIVSPQYWPVLYNGQFRKYDTVFTATGAPYESFILIDLDPKNNVYVDHDNFHVYIEHVNEQTGETTYKEWHRVQNLVLDSTYNSKDYQIRMNESKVYVLSFGDDIHGQMLKYGDKIHVIYLFSNVQDGKIQNGEVEVKSMDLKVKGFTNNLTFFDMCYGGIKSFRSTYKGIFVENNVTKEVCSKIQLNNLTQSTEPKAAQSVQSIRQNAPGMFRMGGRLVTIDDYKNYVMAKFSHLIRDVWVCNNTTYITTFYQWLSKYNALNVNIRKYNYLYSDTCDFNNVYLWMKSNNRNTLSNDDFNSIIKSCNIIKTATVEVVPCNAIIKYFTPFVQHKDYPISYDEILFENWNPNTKIRITKKPGTYFSNVQIIEDVTNKILDYFSIPNQQIGNTVNIDELYANIMKLGYIESIKTVNTPSEDQKNEYWVDGLSFASFSLDIINGADFNTITFSDQLQPFQFAALYNENIIKSLIEIENKDTFSLTNTGF